MLPISLALVYTKTVLLPLQLEVYVDLTLHTNLAVLLLFKYMRTQNVQTDSRILCLL